MLSDVILSSSLNLRIPWKVKQLKTVLPEIPKNCFGVFVSAKRGKDTHGCIGYWDEKFAELSKTQLLIHACEVGNKAFWEDERRKNFQTNILQEPDSICEIDFMMRPVVPLVDGMINGQPFSNNTHGLLVKTKDGKKAVYLPKTFEDISWPDIKARLLKKAKIINKEGVFYAFTIQQMKVAIGTICDSKNVALCLKENFKENLYKHKYTSFPFFPLYYKNGIYSQFSDIPDTKHEKDAENLRNCMILMELFESEKGGVDFTEKQWDFYRNALEKTKTQPLKESAISFLFPCFEELGYDTKELCKQLYDSLLTVGRVFAFGEILVALANSKCKINLDSMVKKLVKSYPLSKAKDLFQVNWDCQALTAIQGHIPSVILDSFLTVIKAQKIGPKSHTNILAVSWECIKTIYPHCNDEYKKKFDRYKLYFCYLLQQRGDPKHPTTYLNLDGSARLDLTAHIMRGWNIYTKQPV